MIKFDLILSHGEEYYINKMKELDREYTKKEKIIGKNYIKGIHFKPQGEKIFGHYCPNYGLYTRGSLIPFSGKFIRDAEGNLKFSGIVYPQILATALILLCLILSVFLTKRSEMIIICTLFLTIDLFNFFSNSRKVLNELEKFFV